MIRGLGIDLVLIHRIERLIQRFGDRFTRRIFSPQERAHCARHGKPAKHYAARFAAKEAMLKAMGVPRGLRWHELEVISGPSGAPRIQLDGAAARAAAALGITSLHLSLTHEGDTAAAVVIAEGK